MQQLWNPNGTTTLVLVRHAQAADRDSDGHLRLCGWLDVPLTVHGQLEAEHLPACLAGLGPVAALYSSPLRRALETAKPIARWLGMKPRALNSLREISCGELEGLPVVEVQRRHRGLWQANLAQVDDGFCWPGGESYRAFRRRVLRTLERLRQAHAGRTIVVITHSGVVSQVVGSLAGQPAARWETFRPATASLTEVRWTGERGGVVRFNDRRHLVGLSSPDSIGPPDDPQVLAHGRLGGEPLAGGPAGRTRGHG